MPALAGLRPYPMVVQEAQLEGWRVGSPPWVDRRDLEIDVEVVAAMVCGGCGTTTGLRCCWLHRPAPEGRSCGGRYRCVAWCPNCAQAEEA